MVNPNISFLSPIEAQQQIIRDTMEHFFDYVQPLDMSIQLKKNFPEAVACDSILSFYKTSLQHAVLPFSEKEKAFVLETFRKIYTPATFDLTDLIKTPVTLLKVSGIHYGDGAYYTREGSIVIPANELKFPDPVNFEAVMLHELFHIYSRYHPEQRKALYALIGFEDIGTVEQLEMDTTLRRRVLLNPDGVDYAYAIPLHQEAKEVLAIPLIRSVKPRFDPVRPAFFDYLIFDLYGIKKETATSLLRVESGPKGAPLAKYQEYLSFKEQIADNTDYIIHPDEILADNFVLLLKGPTAWSTLSPSGKTILEGMRAILFEDLEK